MYGISISSSSFARYVLSPYLATIYHHHQSRTFSKPSNSYWTYSFRSVPTMIVKNHSKKKIHLNSINQTESIELLLGWLSCIGMLAYCFAEIVIKYEIPSSDITNTALPPLPSTTKHPGLDWVYLPLFFLVHTFTLALYLHILSFLPYKEFFRVFVVIFLVFFFFVFLTLYVVVVQTNTHSIIICCCCCCNCSLLNGLFVKWFYENFYPR